MYVRQELSVALAPRESGELGAAVAAGEGARFGTRWAETEEAACLLMARPCLRLPPGCRAPDRPASTRPSVRQAWLTCSSRMLLVMR